MERLSPSNGRNPAINVEILNIDINFGLEVQTKMQPKKGGKSLTFVRA